MGITITPNRDRRFQEVEKRFYGDIITVKLMDEPVRPIKVDAIVLNGDPNDLI
jgi:hypothetical protein